MRYDMYLLYICIHECIHTHMHTRAHTQVRARGLHTHTHTHAYTNTHTRANTHACNRRVMWLRVSKRWLLRQWAAKNLSWLINSAITWSAFASWLNTSLITHPVCRLSGFRNIKYLAYLKLRNSRILRKYWQKRSLLYAADVSEHSEATWSPKTSTFYEECRITS